MPVVIPVLMRCIWVSVNLVGDVVADVPPLEVLLRVDDHHTGQEHRV